MLVRLKNTTAAQKVFKRRNRKFRGEKFMFGVVRALRGGSDPRHDPKPLFGGESRIRRGSK